MSNPESFARIPCASLIKQLDHIKERIDVVCQANTINALVKAYGVYLVRCKRSWLNWFKTVKPKSFNDWVLEIYNDYVDILKNNYFNWTSLYYNCADNDNYSGARGTIRMLANNSENYVFLGDEHLSLLTAAYNKCRPYDECLILVNQMLADHPALKIALKVGG